MVRGKFTVTKVAEMSWSKTAREITLSAQYDTKIPEDQKYAQATPSANIVMTVDNPSAVNQLKVGQSFYVDFHPVE